MKKMFFAIPLVIVLLSLTIAWVGAGMDLDDPKLCVEGKWLLVDAALPSGVRVTVPEEAVYGNQRQGRCKTPGPDVPLITAVKERGEHHRMVVFVDGKQATTPTVTVSYGQETQVKKNTKGMMVFTFTVR